MYLIRSRRVETGEQYHVFVEVRPDSSVVPNGCRLVGGVNLTAHPPCDDPDAPTLRVVLYRDPASPNDFHYLLPPARAKHLKRVGGAPFVYRTWEEFAEMHPAVVAEMAG